MDGVVISPQVEDALLSQFLEVALGQTAAAARNYLRASGWDLEQALQLFFVGRGSYDDYTWLDYQDPPHSSPPQSSDDVWGERASSDDGEDGPAASDGEAEMERNDSSSIIHSRDESEIPVTDNNDHRGTTSNNLASMFRPPLDLIFKGDFEQAKDVAKAQNRWLLVNVQSLGEFESHRLNRDTWADETVALIVAANLIFWQVNHDTEMGMKVCSYYKIGSFPLVMVIDPITGQKMDSWTGFIQPVDLMDKLTRFMDTSPKEHILSLFNKRPQAHEAQHEEEENEDVDQKIAEEQASEMPLYPPLPEEPKCDKSLLCGVGIRLPPDGRRVQRNFLLSDPIQLLWSFCFSELNEEARTRPFQLTQGMPGRSKYLEYDTGLTFEESGLANSIVSVRLE